MDRQTAADLLDNLLGMVDDSQGNDYDTALRMGIEALKADVQPVRHGHWAEENGFIYCPFCGDPWGAPGCESMVKSFNYCPNCGARMDGEQNG